MIAALMHVCVCVCFPQDPTPITAMELSTKQVQTCPQASALTCDLPGRAVTFAPAFRLLLAFAATAVPGLGSGRLADAAAPLRGVRESLRRVLPGPGPVLRLGRHRVFQILSHRQEVGGRPCTLTPTLTRTDKYLPFIPPHCLLGSGASCARSLAFCVSDVTGGRTWELSCAPAACCCSWL